MIIICSFKWHTPLRAAIFCTQPTPSLRARARFLHESAETRH